MPKRTSVYLPDETVERARPYRDKLNYSELLRVAVEAELERLEAEPRTAAKRDAPQWVEDWYNYAPLAAAAQLQRANGEVSPPPDVYREIIKRGAEYGPAYVEAALGQWNAGTISVWQRIKGNES